MLWLESPGAQFSFLSLGSWSAVAQLIVSSGSPCWPPAESYSARFFSVAKYEGFKMYLLPSLA